MKQNYKGHKEQTAVAGTVFVSFSIYENGSIGDVKVIRPLCESCDAEAIRLISEMPCWNPATIYGKPTYEHMVLPVKFGFTNPYQ